MKVKLKVDIADDCNGGGYYVLVDEHGYALFRFEFLPLLESGKSPGLDLSGYGALDYLGLKTGDEITLETEADR